MAGGFGTRLQSVISDRPKVMAEVCGRPFLSYLLDQLSSAGFRRVIISTGYMASAIEEHFGGSYGALEISYSREDEPLGTGGGLRLAISHSAGETVVVMNGDSYIDADLRGFVAWFFEEQREAAVVLTKAADTSRFGRIKLGENKIIASFEEKNKIGGVGWINAGVYALRRPLIGAAEPGTYFSLERDFFPNLAGSRLFGYCVEGAFLDIGTPQSYSEAEAFFRRAGKEA